MKQGYIGTTVQDLTPAVAALMGLHGQRGALIVRVAQGGPATGIVAPGDVIIRMNGEQISSSGGLTRRIAEATPGESLILAVIRDGRSREVAVSASERPSHLPT